MPSKCRKISVGISSTEDSINFRDGCGFFMAKILSEPPYKSKYKITILLHGGCLKYGLTNSAYQERYKEPNPYASFLTDMRQKNVKIKICQLCITKSGFKDDELLPFVKPVPYIIDYMLQFQTKKDHFIAYA